MILKIFAIQKKKKKKKLNFTTGKIQELIFELNKMRFIIKKQKQPPRGVLKICSKFTGEHSC